MLLGPRQPVGAPEGRVPDLKPRRLPGAERVGETPAAPPLILRSLPVHLSSSPPSLPLTPLGPMRPRRSSEGGGPGQGALQASRALTGWGNARHAPPWSSEPPRVPPGVGTLPPSQPLWGRQSYPASTSPPPSLPPRPARSLGGSSHLLGCQGPPTSVRRRPSCGETQTPRPPPPPSCLYPPPYALLLLTLPLFLCPFPCTWTLLVVQCVLWPHLCPMRADSSAACLSVLLSIICKVLIDHQYYSGHKATSYTYIINYKVLS